MKCLICNEYFYIKRHILDLFKTEKEYVCNKCYKKYPINLKFNKLQLDKFDCIILSIFDKKYNIEYNAYIKEYNKIFKANYNRDGYIELFIDHIKLNIDTLEALDYYSKLLNSNLIILCFSFSE